MQCLIKQTPTDRKNFREKVGALVYGGEVNLPVILKHGTSLVTIGKLKGDQFVVTILGLLIVDFQNSFNLIRPLTDTQIATVASDLASDYVLYRLEDFVAFFHLAKRGVYGKILDRLDPGTVSEMFFKYDQERVNRLSAGEMSKQESKQNINPFAEYDRKQQNGNFTDRSAPIGDFISKVKKMPKEEK